MKATERSSHLRCSVRKGVLRNFTKFTGKHLFRVSFLIKLQALDWSRVNNTVVLTILTFQHIQCLHLMYAEVAWVLVSSATQVQSQVILDPDYLPDYLSVSHDYGKIKHNSPDSVPK